MPVCIGKLISICRKELHRNAYELAFRLAYCTFHCFEHRGLLNVNCVDRTSFDDPSV